MAKEKRKRKKVKRRALSLFLAAALVVSGINLPASAVTVYAEETSGNPEKRGDRRLQQRDGNAMESI